jgi:D-methionine transport system permease protein
MTTILNILHATSETLYMVVLSTFFASVLGVPLGTILFCQKTLTPHKHLYRGLNFFINSARSVPFIILLVALIPLTRFITGSSIGINAAIVPLSLGATPLVARLINNIYENIEVGLFDVGQSMGATSWQMIKYILIPEALAEIIQTISLTAITLVNYSAMAGTVGGGGLGDLAIRYGYQRFDLSVMIITIIIMVMIVQCMQFLGDKVSAKFKHN